MARADFEALVERAMGEHDGTVAALVEQQNGGMPIPENVMEDIVADFYRGGQ